MTQGPFKPIFSFRNLKLHYEKLLDSENIAEQFQAKQVVSILEKCPQLEKGTDVVKNFDIYKTEIEQIMSFIFPAVLTNNEIKAAVYPYTNDFFYVSNRLKCACH